MTIEGVADRLARLLTAVDGQPGEVTGRGLLFDDDRTPRPLVAAAAPADCWAVDGGQALVADARSVAVYATRAATVRWRQGASAAEDQGDLAVHLVGSGQERTSLAAVDAPVDPGAPVDVNLLRDWGEWKAVRAAVVAADRGAMVLVDGDLQPDWRIRSHWLTDLIAEAADRGVTLAGVTKHSSLSVGGAPLLGIVERHATATLGRRATWWAPVARTRPDVEPGLRVVVARLDPDARFAFRVDLVDGTPVKAALGALAGLSNDAAFPGYPYPLSVADRLAACGPWVRAELWDTLSGYLEALGLDPEVSDRAFADRHRLMERP